MVTVKLFQSTGCLKIISNLVGPGPHYSDVRYVKPGPKIDITWHSWGELGLIVNCRNQGMLCAYTCSQTILEKLNR